MRDAVISGVSTAAVRLGFVGPRSAQAPVDGGPPAGTTADPLPPTPAEPAAPTADELTASDLERFDWLGLMWDIWNAELFHVGGAGIRLSQIVIALLVILIGLWVARQVALRVNGRLRKVKRIDANLAAAVQKIVFYLLAVLVFFIALPIAGIPSTIFTVLGGAVAIGVGLGAQNLCNNLISGLILMIERPIRLGDIVEVGDETGRIEDIGNRCTRIRRFDGIDVIVPNSSLLQQPVVNWTLKDADLCGKVAVGVAYGSPTATGRDLIARAATEHDRVHADPPPEVLFVDFGDNTLSFEVYFWTAVTRPLDLRRIESDLRYRIDELFREAGITIAFPQRDLHLDTLRPLEVRLTRDDPPGDAAADTP